MKTTAPVLTSFPEAMKPIVLRFIRNIGEYISDKLEKSLPENISEFTGISASFLSDLENGKKTIELDKALKIANLLGLDVELNERG